MLSGKDSERVIFGLSLQAVLESEKLMNLVGVYFWLLFGFVFYIPSALEKGLAIMKDLGNNYMLGLQIYISSFLLISVSPY